MNNQIEKNFNNCFKNDLEEIKNNFVKIKSMISQKRKPEENIQYILEKINNSGKNKTINKNIGNCDNEEKTNKNGKDKNRFIIMNENINNKRVNKFIIKDKNKNKTNKKYGTKKKKDNKNIDYYFDKKDIISQNSKNKDNKKINKKFIITHYQENNNDIKRNEKDFFAKINKEINKNFNILNDNNEPKINYNKNFLRKIKNIPLEIKDFYSLDSNLINSKNKFKYLSFLKNYFLKYNSLNQYNKINTNNNKLIYIHNCFNKLKKIPKEINTKINPKNYLIKDEYLIDYEKDSIDDYLEENAEDIKSEDDDEEDEEEDIFSLNQKDINEFIVPDGHLSQDELSDNGLLEDRKVFEKSKTKLIDMKTILNIRKNYIKPIIIDFTKKEKNDKILILSKKLTIGLFCFDDFKDNNEKTDNLNYEREKFPVLIKTKDSKYKEIKDPIKKHIFDIFKKIYGSYDTKDHLIYEINQKFNDISKNILNNFFKEKCLKIHKKYWVVKNEVLNKFNININEIDNIRKENFNIYKEEEGKKARKENFNIYKEEEGKKAKELTKLIRKDNNNNQNINKKEKEKIKEKDFEKEKDKEKDIEKEKDKEKDKESIFEVKKSKRLDKILIENIYRNIR